MSSETEKNSVYNFLDDSDLTDIISDSESIEGLDLENGGKLLLIINLNN